MSSSARACPTIAASASATGKREIQSQTGPALSQPLDAFCIGHETHASATSRPGAPLAGAREASGPLAVVYRGFTSYGLPPSAFEMSAIAFCALDAVARLVERRRDDGDAELAGRDGDDAAADAALGRQARAVEPLAGVVVEAGGRHHREHLGDVLGFMTCLPVTGFLPP